MFCQVEFSFMLKRDNKYTPLLFLGHTFPKEKKVIEVQSLELCGASVQAESEAMVKLLIMPLALAHYQFGTLEIYQPGK